MYVCIHIYIYIYICRRAPPALFSSARFGGLGDQVHQRGMQLKQGVVIYMMLYTSLSYNTTPIHCTPLPLHPPVMNAQERGVSVEGVALVGDVCVCVYFSLSLSLHICIYIYTHYIYIYIHRYTYIIHIMYVCI